MENSSNTLSTKKRMVGITIITFVDLLLGFGLFIASFRFLFPFQIFLAHFAGFLFAIIFLLSIAFLFIWTGLLTLRLETEGRKINFRLSIFGILATPSCYMMQLYIINEQKLRPLSIYSKMIFLAFLLYFIWSLIYSTRPKVKAQFK